MKLLTNNKTSSALLTALGFAAWITCGLKIDGGDPALYLSGSFIFFIVAIFLPDSQPVTFLSRRSALGLVGLCIWLASELVFPEYLLNARESDAKKHIEVIPPNFIRYRCLFGSHLSNSIFSS